MCRFIKKLLLFLFILVVFPATLCAAESHLDETDFMIDDDGFVYNDGNIGVNEADPQLKVYVNQPTLFQESVYTEEVVTTMTDNVIIDWNLSNKQRIIINTILTKTVTFTPPTSGYVGSLVLLIQHDKSGEIGWPASVKWSYDNLPNFTKTPEGSIDVVTFYYYSGAYYSVTSTDMR
jgi:hypothetical protein